MLLINPIWLGNMILIFSDLETLGNSLLRQEVDYSKSYAIIPSIVDSVVKLWPHTHTWKIRL